MPPFFAGFLQNLLLPLALVYTYGLIVRFRAKCSHGEWAAIIGVLFGSGSALCMLLPLEVRAGVTIDNRMAPLVLAALFGGPYAAVIALVVVGYGRHAIGGVGEMAGLAALTSAAVVGMIASRGWSVRSGTFRLSQAAILGAILVAVTLPWALILPAEIDPVALLKRMALPVVIMYPIGTVLVAGLLLQVESQHRLGGDLRASEQRFRALFAHAPDAIFIADADSGRILDANPRACALIDRPHAEVITLHQADLHPVVEADSVREKFHRHREESRVGSHSTALPARVITKGGIEIQVEVVAQAMDLSGRQVLVGFFRDLREREQAEKALAAATELTGHIVRTAAAAIVGLDSAGRIVLCNPTLAQLCQRESSAIIGCSWLDDVVPADRFAATHADFTSLLKTGHPRSIEGPVATASASHAVMDWRCSVVADSGSDLRIIAVGIDVSEQRALEERLRQADKMQAIGQLAGGIAHDFNNHLQIISGYVHMLQDGVPESQRQPMLDVVLHSCVQAGDLTAKLLAFSRKATVRRAPVQVNELVHAVATLVQAGLGSRIAITTDFNPAAGTILGDAASLQSALINMIFNARDAMPDGGTISLSTGMGAGEDHAAQGFNLPPGPCALIRIRDTGSGMSAAVLARIFEPFFTTKPLGKGTGLGLAAVYGTVQEHHGAITVTSVEDSGTTFTVAVPTIAADVSGPVPLLPSAPLPGPAAGCIVIVDDEMAIREMIRQTLVGQGHDVQAFTDGAELLNWCRSHPEGYRLAIVDLHMPGLSGTQVISGLVELSPILPIIICTGHGPTALDEVHPLSAHLSIITKPFLLDDLTQHVAQRLAAVSSG